MNGAPLLIRADVLLAAARQQTGLDDFGSDSFREGLGVFCESASSEAQLNQIGAAVLPGAILSCLTNRLKVVDWVKRHPETSAERIESPTVVIGMFRAGTTFLSYLLEKDERHRPLLRPSQFRGDRRDFGKGVQYVPHLGRNLRRFVE